MTLVLPAERANEVLLERLKTAEQQMMIMMKQDMNLSCSDEKSADEGKPDSFSMVINMLAKAKVELAEKEFEAMELQGKLRAREAQIEALMMHLGAAKQEALQKCRVEICSDVKKQVSQDTDEVDSITHAKKTGQITNKVVNISVAAS